MSYQIIISGKLLGDTSKAGAVESLARLFRIPSEKAERTLSKAPATIKKNVDSETAQKYKAALEKIGIECLVKANAQTVVASSYVEEQVAVIADGEESVAYREQSVAVVETPTQTVSKTDEELNAENAEPQPGYQFKFEGRPDYGFVTVQIPAGETLKVEASAMATMDTNIRMKTKLKGGFGRFLTGESLFINDFTAEGGSGEVGIAPASPGDIGHVFLQNETIYLQNSAYVASTTGVEVETKWQGLTKGFFSGENLFLIRCKGNGDLWFNTYGAMIEIDVDGGYVVDTGNIVAFTEGLEYKISKVGGYKSLFFSGEGFVCRFSGKGKVWLQTRGVDAFASWVHPFRPVKKKG